jgi:hypothetical protein
MGDAPALANYLRVKAAAVPADPETLPWPKQALVDLSRRSRSRAVYDDMVPERGALVPTGPGYTGRLIDFAAYHWRPEVAAAVCPSLASCLAALERLKATL